jgi:hypothetical protein
MLVLWNSGGSIRIAPIVLVAIFGVDFPAWLIGWKYPKFAAIWFQCSAVLGILVWATLLFHNELKAYGHIRARSLKMFLIGSALVFVTKLIYGVRLRREAIKADATVTE